MFDATTLILFLVDVFQPILVGLIPIVLSFVSALVVISVVIKIVNLL